MAYAYKRTITIDYTKVTGQTEISRAAWSASASSYLAGYEPGFQATQAIIDNKSFSNQWPFWASNNEKPAYHVVNFGSAITFDTIEIDTTSNENRIWTSWEIYVSSDGATWGTAIKTGAFAASGLNTITLDSPVTYQYLKTRVITQTADNYICIRDLKVRNVGSPVNHANFPICIVGTLAELATVANGGKVTSASGYDIVFAADEDGNTILDFERVLWNATTGEFEFWVKIPDLSCTVDTVIYLLYGNSAITTDQQDAAGTWSNGFLAVYHMQDAGASATIKDSLGVYDATAGSTNAATTGKIKGGTDVDDGSTYNGVITVPSLGTFGFGSAFTLEVWALAGGGDNQWILSQITNTNDFVFYICTKSSGGGRAVASTAKAGGGDTQILHTSLWDTETWNKVTGRLNTAGYVVCNYNSDGKVFAIVDRSAQVISATANAKGWTIGKLNHNSTDYYRWLGSIDEVRISNVYRGDGWLATSYAVESDPASFYEIGDEEGGVGFVVALSDSLSLVSDSLSVSSFVGSLSVSISDTLQILGDLPFPPPAIATHFDGSISDILQIIQDQISGILNQHLSGSLADRLELIEDYISAGKINIETPVRWVAPIAITPKTSAVDSIYLAAHAIRHPDRYYEPRIKSYGTFTRAISAPAGFVKTGDVSLNLIDPDNSLRQRIAPKTIRKATAEIRLGPEGGKLSSFLRPFKREVGTVGQPGDGELSMPLRDYIFDKLEKQMECIITAEYFPNLPESPARDHAQNVIGIVSAIDGAVPCFLIDTARNGWLVAGHPCLSVDEVYRKLAGDDYFSLVDPSEYTVENGTFYCMLLFNASPSLAGGEIRANVHGYYDADTGLLKCTNFADFILEVLTVMMGVEESLDRINLGSFDDTRIACADLLCAGAILENLTYGELLTRIQRSSNIDIFADKNDKVSIHYTADDEQSVIDLDDILRLYKGTVSQQLADPTYNQIVYRYNQNPATDKWTEEKLDNLADQTALGEIVPEEPLQMYFVRDAVTALAVAERRMQYLDLDSFRFEGEIPLIAVLENLELANIVGITHFGGIKSGGYAGEQFKILELSMDIDNLKYRFKGIRRRLPAPPTILGSISGVDKINSRVGPFSRGVNGEMFAIWCRPEDQTHLIAYKTIDYGANWTEMDTANEPALGAVIQSFDSSATFMVTKNLIHVATQELGGRVAYHTFSMATGTWITVNDEIVASCNNGGSYCVSVECRNPGLEPVVYWQGDRVLKDGTLYGRGWYSIKQSGTWQTPVIVTPDPGNYQENFEGPFHADCVSRDCFISRVLPGAENRMHFFYNISPAVVWIQWSPDEYAVTVQDDFTQSGRQFQICTTNGNNAVRNIGGGISFDNGNIISIVQKISYGAASISTEYDGPELSEIVVDANVGWYMSSGGGTLNPPAFLGVDGSTLYLAFANWATPVKIVKSFDYGATWTDQRQACDYQWVILGNFFKIHGKIYVGFFNETGGTVQEFRWLQVDKLPLI